MFIVPRQTNKGSYNDGKQMKTQYCILANNLDSMSYLNMP